MYKYNNILVGLDLSDIDIDILNATNTICKLSGSKSVTFINIIRDINVPEKLLKEFPGLIENAISERKNEIHELIKAHFDNQNEDLKVNICVEQGQVSKVLLKHSAKDKIDLIILGRKKEKKDGVVLLNRIARRIACSLLIVPKGSQISYSRILVPTDFSAYSKYAMEKALTMAKRSKSNEKLIVQHVYQVPVGYHYSGKTFEEFGKIMKEHAKNDFDKFISEFNTKGINIDPVFSLDKDDDIISDIYKTGKKLKSTIIVIGAKGRTATSAFFIGSKAEKLIEVETEIPMLVVRPKGKNAGLLEYLKGL